MTDTHKLDAAFDRFEAALMAFEGSLARRQDGEKQAQTLASEADSLRSERSRISKELELVRSKASELVTTNKSAVGKIDAAMSRIRAVLHSNSGG